MTPRLGYIKMYTRRGLFFAQNRAQIADERLGLCDFTSLTLLLPYLAQGQASALRVSKCGYPQLKYVNVREERTFHAGYSAE